MQHNQPPHKPPLPKLTTFVIVEYVWTVVRRQEILKETSKHFTGTLAAAKASLVDKVFYTAKIYECGELVAGIRGTQTHSHPIS